MTEGFLIHLQRALRPKERIRLTIESTASGLVVLLEPLLAKAPTDLPPEAAQARAFLSVPLRLQGTAEQLDATFFQRVADYAGARSKLATETDGLTARLNEAAKETRAKAVDAGARPAKSDAATTPSAPTPKAAATPKAKSGSAASAPTVPAPPTATSTPPSDQPQGLFD